VRLLLDSSVWGKARGELEATGHDVIWVGDWTSDPGDEEILATAHREGRVLVTLDADFGELAVRDRRPHAGILRLVGIAATAQAGIILQVIATSGGDLLAGALITATPQRIRIRRPNGR
jgi:predicted nuclease of predicted toxin-antitoxin system